jgi:hypothetical protein
MGRRITRVVLMVISRPVVPMVIRNLAIFTFELRGVAAYF